MKISIIIPTLNEKSNITDCLVSLYEQDCEIVVIDGGSTDGTAEYVKKVWGKRVSFHSNKGNVSVGRNHGIRKAKGDWIALVDADSRAEPDFIEKLKKRIKENPKADGFRIKYDYSRKDGWLSRTWGLDCHNPTEEADSNPSVFKKSKFPFYNEKLSEFEDRELWDRLKGKYIPCPEIVQTHASKKNFAELEKHMNWYGKYHHYPTFLWMLLVLPMSFLKVPIKLWRTQDPYAVLIPLKDLLRIYSQLRVSLHVPLEIFKLVPHFILLPILIPSIVLYWGERIGYIKIDEFGDIQVV